MLPGKAKLTVEDRPEEAEASKTADGFCGLWVSAKEESLSTLRFWSYVARHQRLEAGSRGQEEPYFVNFGHDCSECSVSMSSAYETRMQH